MLRKLVGLIFSKENLLALALAVLLILIVIFSSDTSATWIYQGF